MPKDYKLLIEGRVQMASTVELLYGFLLLVHFLNEKKGIGDSEGGAIRKFLNPNAEHVLGMLQ